MITFKPGNIKVQTEFGEIGVDRALTPEQLAAITEVAKRNGINLKGITKVTITAGGVATLMGYKLTEDGDYINGKIGEGPVQGVWQ